jgi:hypothetical protein
MAWDRERRSSTWRKVKLAAADRAAKSPDIQAERREDRLDEADADADTDADTDADAELVRI